MEPREPEGEIRALLRDADPVASARVEDAAATRLLRDVAGTGREPKRRRRHLLVAGLVVAIVGVAAPAAAVVLLSARTGEFGSPGFTEHDTSEWIITSAPDFVDESRTLYPEWLPLPDGVSAEDFRVAEATRIHEAALATIEAEPDIPAVEQTESGVRRTFEWAAYCMWLNEFELAHEAGDLSRRQAAADVLSEATTWPATVASDGGGIVDRMRDVADSAAAGESDLVRAQIQADCDASWTPERYR